MYVNYHFVNYIFLIFRYNISINIFWDIYNNFSFVFQHFLNVFLNLIKKFGLPKALYVI